MLADWRRIDLTSAEGALRNGTRPVNAIVSGVLKGLRLDQRQKETEIVRVWNHLVDSHVATHAQPVGLRNGTLFIHVDSSAWLSEIVRYRQQEILRRLQASFGSSYIRRLSFRIG